MAGPRVLLVNPWITDFAAHDLWARPAGLILLAGLLRQAGFQVGLIDCLQRPPPGSPSPEGMIPGRPGRHGTGKFAKTPIPVPDPLASLPRRYFRYGIAPQELSARLDAQPRPDLIWVSSGMTYWYPGVRQTIAALRSAWPDAPIWLGGTYARLCSDHARRTSGADRVVGLPPGQIPALLATCGHPVAAPAGWADLAQAPRPAHDLVDYAAPYATLVTSLGCPNRCPYCGSAVLREGFSRRPAEALLEEIRWLADDLGIHDLAFHDDALLVDAETSLRPALEQIAAGGPRVRFHVPNGLHVNALTDAWAGLLRRAGFVTLRLGLETTRDRRTRDLGGKTSTDAFLRAMETLCRAGFDGRDIGVYLLAGLPGQPVDEVLESIRRVEAAGAQPFISEYAPVPGSALWNKALETSAFDLGGEPLTHNNSFFACRRKDFGLEELEQIKDRARRARKRIRLN